MKRNPGRPKHDDILTPAEWRTVESIERSQSWYRGVLGSSQVKR